MKRYILSIIIVLSGLTSINAQENITVKIGKLIDGNKTYVKVSITNNGNGDISLYNRAEYGINAGIYESKPNSYMTIIGSNTAGKLKRSDPVVLSGTIGLRGESAKKFVLIKKGETLTDQFLLFGSDHSPYTAFNNSDRSSINHVKVELNLNYYDFTDQKNKKLKVTSNTILVPGELIENPEIIPPTTGNGNNSGGGGSGPSEIVREYQQESFIR